MRALRVQALRTQLTPPPVTGDVTLGNAFVPGLAQTFKNVQGLRAGEHFLEVRASCSAHLPAHADPRLQTLFQPCVGTAKFPSS